MKPRIYKYASGEEEHYYLDEDLKEFLTPEEYKKFNQWICGQTCTMLDGRIAIYAHDVQRFVNMVRKGTPTYFD